MIIHSDELSEFVLVAFVSGVFLPSPEDFLSSPDDESCDFRSAFSPRFHDSLR